MPKSIKPPLPVSTTEWIPSVSIAELPVKADAINFVTAIKRFPMIAAKIAVFDSLSVVGSLSVISYIEPKKIAPCNASNDFNNFPVFDVSSNRLKTLTNLIFYFSELTFGKWK
jgi:hypothetical protein